MNESKIIVGICALFIMQNAIIIDLPILSITFHAVAVLAFAIMGTMGENK